MANSDPRSLIVRFYVGDHYTLLQSKYISCGPDGFREGFFLSFSHYMSMGANDPRDVASLGPRGLNGRIYVGDHKHCYILNMKAVGLMVSGKIFKVFFPPF